MAEYVEREAALRHKRKMSGTDFCGEFWDEAVLCEDIRKIPAADVVEVRHGEWLEEKEYYADDYSECNVRKVYACSLCGRTEKRKEPYCNCGAKMDGKGDGE